MSGATTATSHKSGPGHLEVPLALATDWGRITGKTGSYRFVRRISTDKTPFSVLSFGVVVYPKVDLWPYPF